MAARGHSGQNKPDGPSSYEMGKQNGRTEATLETVQDSIDDFRIMFSAFERRCQGQFTKVEQNSTGIRWLVRATSALFVLVGFVIVAALRSWFMKGG